jgi:DNA-binding response OmpR family regulator
VNVQLESTPAKTGGAGGSGARRGGSGEQSAAKPSAAALYCPSEVRILVVDDEPVICQLIQGALTQPNFVIDVVSDPAQVEAALQVKPYHLIILDYCIPGLETTTVFDWIKRDQADASVIVVTGFPSLDSVVSCLRARIYDYLTKPFDISQLELVVRRCLEAKGLLRLSEEALRETLGATIRERRKALGLTLAQMAERTNVSLGYLSQIELGKNSASIETLYRICLGLGIKMADLFQAVRS